MNAPAATRPQTGDELELKIDRLAHGGNGVARTGDGGYVVFVQGGIPGDTVRAVVTKRNRKYAEARTIEVLTPGPDRIDAVADHPGAAWQVMPYAVQLAHKQEQVEDALRRIGKLDGFEMEQIVPAVQEWGYRNKLEYSFGFDENAPGSLVCGFHAPGSWETIIDGESKLGSERAATAREQVLAWARHQGLDAYDRRTTKGFLRNLVIREGRRTGELQVRLVTSPGEIDAASLEEAVPCDSLVWTRMDGVGETTHGGFSELVAGRPAIHEELSGLRFTVSAEAFFQTNTEMAEQLYAVAAEYADLKGWERVYDLFCGIGTIGLVLSQRAGEVWD